VRGGLDVGQRRAADAPGLLTGVDAVRDIRTPVADNCRRERVDGGNVLPEPGQEPVEIEAGGRVRHHAVLYR
jgi:hypothetical protein